MMSLTLAAILGIGVALFAARAGATSAERAPPAAQASATITAAWRAFAAKFVMADGRVIDDANGSVSHSEGQGFAMLMAAAAGDRESFARLWSWTKSELLIRDDGLAAWRWDPKASPNVTDTNNASDGDLLIAWALLEAGTKWRRQDYTSAGTALADAVGRNVVVPSPFGPLLMPGAKGFKEGEQPDGPVINLSYWVFPAIERIKSVSRTADWDGLVQTGLKLIGASRFGPARLPTDWVSLAGGVPKPAQAFPARFSYDAVRVPLYLAWAYPSDLDRLQIFSEALGDGSAAPPVMDIASGRPLEAFGGMGFRALAGLVRCAVSGSPLAADLRRVQADLYYPTALHVLTLVAAENQPKRCLRS